MAIAPKQVGRVLPVGNTLAGGVVFIGSGPVETARLLTISQITAGQVLLLPTPVDATPFTVVASNTGTVAFTMYGVSMLVGSSGTFTWNGTAWQPPVQPASAVVTQLSVLRGSRSVPQTTGIAVAASIQFNTVDPASTSTDISLNTASGVITLAAGKIYRLIGAAGNTSGGRMSVSWRNLTAGTYIGNTSDYLGPVDTDANAPASTACTALIAPLVATQVSLVFFGNMGNVFPAAVGGQADNTSSLPWFDIEVIGGNAPVSSLSQYGTSYQTSGNLPAIGTSSAAAAVSTLFTLPGPGTFLVAYFGSGGLLGTNGGAINYALYANPTGAAGAATGGVLVANSEIRAIFENANTSAYMATGTGVISITTTAPTLYALGFFAAGATAASTGSLSDTGGRTGVTWTQIGAIPLAGLLAGATSTLPGAAGFTPGALAGQQDAVLRGDAGWDLTAREASALVANLAANGPLATAPLSVDIASTLFLNQTTAGIVATLPVPTVSKARRLTLVNLGTASITVLGISCATSVPQTFVWNPSTLVWLPPSGPGATLVGATTTLAGVAGIVPAPALGQQTYYLRGDGTWSANDAEQQSVIPDQPSGGPINTDGFSVIFIAQSTGGQTVTLKPPVDTIRQRRIRVIHNGTQAVTIQGAMMLVGTSQTYTYFGNIGGGWIADLAPDWRSGTPTYFALEPLFTGSVRYVANASVRGTYRYVGAVGIPATGPGLGTALSIANWEPISAGSMVTATCLNAQSVASGVVTAMDFGTLAANSTTTGDLLWDAVNKGYIIPYTGIYDIDGIISFAANGTGFRQSLIAVATGPATAGLNIALAQSAGTPVATIMVNVRYRGLFTAGQVIGLYSNQSSGGAISTVVAVTGSAPRLSIALARLT